MLKITSCKAPNGHPQLHTNLLPKTENRLKKTKLKMIAIAPCSVPLNILKSFTTDCIGLGVARINIPNKITARNKIGMRNRLIFFLDMITTRMNVSQIAQGIPMGGDLKYTDAVTLKRALEGRRES